MFSSKSIILSRFTLRFFTHLELTFVYVMKYGRNRDSVFYMDIQLTQYNLMKRGSSSPHLCASDESRYVGPTCLFILTPVSHFLNYYSIKISLYTCAHVNFPPFPLLRTVLSILDFFHLNVIMIHLIILRGFYRIFRFKDN